MFEMFKVNEGGKWHFGTAATLEEARETITSLAECWPAEYAILDRATGEWTSFPAHPEKDVVGFANGSLRELKSPLQKHRPARQGWVLGCNFEWHLFGRFEGVFVTTLRRLLSQKSWGMEIENDLFSFDRTSRGNSLGHP